MRRPMRLHELTHPQRLHHHEGVHHHVHAKGVHGHETHLHPYARRACLLALGAALRQRGAGSGERRRGAGEGRRSEGRRRKDFTRLGGCPPLTLKLLEGQAGKVRECRGGREPAQRQRQLLGPTPHYLPDPDCTPALANPTLHRITCQPNSAPSTHHAAPKTHHTTPTTPHTAPSTHLHQGRVDGSSARRGAAALAGRGRRRRGRRAGGAVQDEPLRCGGGGRVGSWLAGSRRGAQPGADLQSRLRRSHPQAITALSWAWRGARQQHTQRGTAHGTQHAQRVHAACTACARTSAGAYEFCSLGGGWVSPGFQPKVHSNAGCLRAGRAGRAGGRARCSGGGTGETLHSSAGLSSAYLPPAGR